MKTKEDPKLAAETMNSRGRVDFLTEHSLSKSRRRRATRYGAQGNSAEADLAGSATRCDDEFGNLGSSESVRS